MNIRPASRYRRRAAEPRSCRRRKRPHGRAGQSARAHRVVVLPALRWRSGVLPAALRRRGEGLHRRRARRAGLVAFRIRAQHRAGHHGAHRSQRRFGAHHRLRAALRAVRPHVPPAAADAHHRADRRPAAHHHPLPPDLGPWPRRHAARARQQSHPLHRRRDDPAHHRRAARLHRPRIAVRAVAPDRHGLRRRHAVRGRPRTAPAANSRSARARTGRNGSGGSAFPTSGRTR